MSNSMHVPPSSVLYTACAGDPGTEGGTEDSKLEELATRLLANSEHLTLQVVEKDGYYFTLNNTQLQVCQWLESRGRCAKVQLLQVPLKAVPEGIKQMMVAPRDQAGEKFMTITYEPMERRPRTARDDDDDDNDDRSGSDDSDGYDSDSICDEAEMKEQQQRRRRQSDESGHEEDTSLL